MTAAEDIQAMNELTGLVERYAAVWNEPDDETRRKAIAGLWSGDAVHTIREAVFDGRDAIEKRVAAAYREFVAGAGFAFRVSGPPLGHHSTVALGWEMVPAAGGAAAARGLAFLLLDGGGLILRDYQYTQI